MTEKKKRTVRSHPICRHFPSAFSQVQEAESEWRKPRRRSRPPKAAGTDPTLDCEIPGIALRDRRKLLMFTAMAYVEAGHNGTMPREAAANVVDLINALQLMERGHDLAALERKNGIAPTARAYLRAHGGIPHIRSRADVATEIVDTCMASIRAKDSAKETASCVLLVLDGNDAFAMFKIRRPASPLRAVAKMAANIGELRDASRQDPERVAVAVLRALGVPKTKAENAIQAPTKVRKPRA